MTVYNVAWFIDIEADSPEEAARRALEIHRDPQSTATYFDVKEDGADESNGYTTIDVLGAPGADFGSNGRDQRPVTGFRSITDIMRAVDAGRNVYWRNRCYKVIRDTHGRYMVQHVDSCVGLLWADGLGSEYKPAGFFTADDE